MGLNCRYIHDYLALPLIPIVQEVGYRGIPIDTAKRDDMLFDISLRLGALAGKMRQDGLDIYQCKSPAAVGWKLKSMGVPLTVTTDGGQWKTDLEVIGRANWNHNTRREREGKTPKFPVLSSLMTYRKLEKARSNLSALIPCDDGMLRTRLQAIGTVSARYASAGFGTKTKPGFCNICRTWGAHGTNLQNIPKDNKALGVNVKEIFVSKPGWLLGELDAKAFEMLIQAHRIKSVKMIARLTAHGADPHSTHAKIMYPEFPGKGTPDGDRQRGTMKNVFYGMRGGGGDRALMNVLAKGGEFFELHDMAAFRRVIEGEYPEQPAWIAATDDMLERQLVNGERRIIRNALGRPRVLFGRRPLKEALATEISGTAADIMSCVFLRLATYYPEVFRYVAMQIHDSILVHAPKDVFWSVMEVVKREMEYPAWQWGEFVSYSVDMKYGEQWSGMREVA